MTTKEELIDLLRRLYAFQLRVLEAPETDPATAELATELARELAQLVTPLEDARQALNGNAGSRETR